MAEENTFFLPVRDFCRRVYHTCSGDDPVFELAGVMRDKNSSSILVCEQDEPVGIITDRDLRNKVVAAGADPRELSARSIMNSPLIVVQEDDYLFDVVYSMLRHRIHRVGVVDEAGRFCGMVNESDLLKAQTQSPQLLVREIEGAEDIAALKSCHAEIERLVVFFTRAGVRTRDLIRIISDMNDRILLRLVTLVRRQQYPDLTDRFSFVVLGSEGRSEQTLKTDQDNAIIYADDLTESELERLEAFSNTLIDSLIEIGVPECPGGIMAKNAFWRRSLSEWKEAVEKWISLPTPENILNFSMFSDVRHVCGDKGLAGALQGYMLRRAGEENLFLTRMVVSVLRFPPPLGFFGGFKTEKGEDSKGHVDLKKAGIFAMTEGVKILGLQEGFSGGDTRAKMQRLRESGVLAADLASDLEASFNLLVFFRLRGQVDAIESGREPSNFITPEDLNRIEKGRFHLALEVVKSFQNMLRNRFHLNLIGA